jgi:hypothetical protein
MAERAIAAMQLPWDEHFSEIVIPAWQAYLAAEERLTAASLGAVDDALVRARYDALREGGAASFYLHHFGEIVLRAAPSWLSPKATTSNRVVEWLAAFCFALRTERQIADVELLKDVADALKHAILTVRVDQRQIAANEAVLVISTGYGEVPFGEGKFGGVPQVVIMTHTGIRPLSTVLQNVLDAWRRVAGLDLPPIGEP